MTANAIPRDTSTIEARVWIRSTVNMFESRGESRFATQLKISKFLVFL